MNHEVTRVTIGIDPSLLAGQWIDPNVVVRQFCGYLQTLLECRFEGAQVRVHPNKGRGFLQAYEPPQADIDGALLDLRTKAWVKWCESDQAAKLAYDEKFVLIDAPGVASFDCYLRITQRVETPDGVVKVGKAYDDDLEVNAVPVVIYPDGTVFCSSDWQAPEVDDAEILDEHAVSWVRAVDAARAVVLSDGLPRILE